MANRSFYRNITMPDPDSSRQIDEEPLIVNCAGYCDFSSPFKSTDTVTLEGKKILFSHVCYKLHVKDASCGN
jgi:hypothetical protein